MAKNYKVPTTEPTIEKAMELLAFFRKSFSNMKDEVVSVGDYLTKGTKIMTLAKCCFAKRLEELEVSSFEEQLFSVEDTGKDYLTNLVAKKVIRPVLKNTPIIEKDGCRSLDSSYEPYAQMMDYLQGFNIVLKPIERSVYSRRFRRQLDSGDSMLLCQYSENEICFNIYGTKNHTHSKSNTNVLFLTGDCVADIATFIAWIIVTSVFKKVTSDSESEQYKMFAEKIKKRYNPYAFVPVNGRIYSEVYKDCMDRDTFDRLSSDIWSHKEWLVPIKDDSDKEKFESITKLLGDVKITYIESNYDDIAEAVVMDIMNGEYKNILDIPVIVPADYKQELFLYDPLRFMERVPELFEYSIALSHGRKSGHTFCMPGTWNSVARIMQQAFEVMYKKVHQTIVEYSSLKKSQSDYASSFETKKNINKETLKAMEESVFNNYFGYVEFDNDVDLKKVSIIADEFVAFKEKYLKGIDSKLNAIRFRKLGNHKALGLYYPFVKCLCVDISSPSSLLHEYAHLIDYCYGGLSKKGEFYSVKRIYESELKKSSCEDEEFGKRMRGKTKYNLDYFLNPTEIFARSFETYIQELEGLNSLKPVIEGAEYPKAVQYIEAVKEYFNAILPILNETKDTEEIMIAATPK